MKQRIIGYDLARALAVFGMVVVNFKVVLGASSTGPAWLVNAVGLLDGRAAATFVVLAGAGLSLFSEVGRRANDGGRLARDRRKLLKRALLLLVGGLAYTPIWPADILHFYGIYIAVGALLLAASARLIAALAAAVVLGFASLIFVLDYEAGWDWSTLTYAGFWTPVGMVRHLFFNGFHPVLPWLAFLLMGMLLGRLDMGSSATRRRVFLIGAGVALVAETVSALLIRTLTAGASAADAEAISALFGTAPMPPMPLYMLAGVGTACSVIAASIEFGVRFQGSRWIRPLVATGQLALTLYVSHVVIGMGGLDALGRLEGQSLPFAVSAALVFILASITCAHLWRKRFKRGPLEALLRAATDDRGPERASRRAE